MKKTLIITILLNSVFLNLQAKEVIETVIVPKGYILSIDLQNKQCSHIWSKEIPAFKKNNKHIKDPNVIPIGSSILVNNCSVSETTEDIDEINNSIVQESVIESKEIVASPIEQKELNLHPFIGLSYVNINVGAKGNDHKKNGNGYIIEFGSKSRFNQDDLKASISFYRTKIKYYDQFSYLNVKTDNGYAGLNLSYLFGMDSLQLGPSMTILYHPAKMSDMMDLDHDGQNSNFLLGVELEKNIMKNVNLNFSLKNQIKDRFNLFTVFGLNYNF